MELDSVDQPGRFFSSLSRDLKSLALCHIQFFENGKQSHHAKFHMSFSLMYEYLDVGIEPSFRELTKYLSRYDYSSEVKGNGYRSLLQIVRKCCLHLLQLSRYISSVKDSMLFRKKFYAKELEAYVSVLGQLRAILYYALKLINYCQDGELFADDEHLNNDVSDHLMMEVESLNMDCFYGRCLGFQYCDSMLRPVQILNIAMASYSEGYLESSGVMQVATSVFNSGKYFLDPELRASQLGKVTRTADVKFCKAFWSITESNLVQQLPSMVCPAVEVNEYFPLGPDAFELPLMDGSDTVVITPPCAHTGPGHVMVRLISSHLREGQQFFQKPTKGKNPVIARPQSSGLLIHMHGGGFVAQSSKSHEIYLRDWARILEVPILSVDYSLAPELPFPRALEDCFYAYSWAVKNCQQLGSVGERIILAGDSAGGNLVISTAMRAASFGIRCPDGIVAVYPVTMARYMPSPARLLSLMDPVLPVGLVSRCLAAYAGVNEEHPLASPSIQQFHSEASLSSIQMQTVESSDNGWVIIGQDQEECLKVGRRMDKSPTQTSDSGSKSVIDSIENSFHEDMPSSSMEDDRLLYRSGSVESDEVEIFSQLQVAGSCVFPKEDRKDGGHRHKVLTRQEATGSRNDKNGVRGNTDNGLTFGGFQEKAKSVIVGAQSMFTSLSSYIPSRTPATPNDTFPTSPPMLVPELAGHFANRDVNSATVDPSSDSLTFNILSENELTDVPLSGTANTSDRLIDNQPDCTETKVDSSEIITSPTGKSDDTQSSSGLFNTAITSPSPGSGIPPLPNDNDHNFDSISLASDLSPLQYPRKPKLGMSPDIESVTKSYPETQEFFTNTTASGPSQHSPFPQPEISNDSPSHPLSPVVPSHSPSSEDLLSPQNDPKPLTPDNIQLSVDLQMTCSIDDVDNKNPESLKSLPGLPPESEELLQDAMKSSENVAHNLNCGVSVSEISSQSEIASQGPAKPPSDLNLATNIRSKMPKPAKCNQGATLSPSPNQIFLEDYSVLDSADADVDATIFETSCLEFLGPSYTSVDGHSSQPTISELEAQLACEMFRSESTPALSSMLSPSPMESTGEKSQLPLLNGFKMGMSPSDFKRQTFTPHSPINTMRKALVVRNPYMSPLMADAELLQGLPPVCLIASHLDPLLDDSVMFAKKLRSLDKSVQLHLIDELPHGFLNFSMVCPEAKKASQFCASKILQML